MPVAKPKLHDDAELLPRRDAGRGGHAANPDRAMSLAEAAGMLGMSQKLLGWNLDDGEIPHHMVGGHRRVMLRDVLALKKQIDRGNKALDEIIKIDQELGFY